MVFLGHMLPTNKEHEEKIKKISDFYAVSIETILNDLIDKRYKEVF